MSEEVRHSAGAGSLPGAPLLDFVCLLILLVYFLLVYLLSSAGAPALRLQDLRSLLAGRPVPARRQQPHLAPRPQTRRTCKAVIAPHPASPRRRAHALL